MAERESACEEARANYTYRQAVTIEEIDPRKGVAAGWYRETTDVVFLAGGERTERALSEARSTLVRLKLTPEDFSDVRNIQPMMIVPGLLPRYAVRYRGEEEVDGVAAWVLELTPKQVFQGFRMFDGLLWIHPKDLSIMRIHGRAVPSLQTRTQENLFPTFTTMRERVDGGCWFPALTWADDTLPFRSGAVRMKLQIRYQNYQRFGAESKVTFDLPETKQPPQP